MGRRWTFRPRWPWITGGVLATLILAIVVVSVLIDERLRRKIEYEMNERLDGYTVRLGKLDFHPIGFSIDFYDLVLTQDAHPDPPVAHFPRVTTSVQWREAIRGKLVADFRFDSPVLHVNQAHLKREAEDEVPVHKRGWQEALEAMYPLKINQFTITNGGVTYIGDGPFKPLRLSNMNVLATNIRNIRSPERVYPSTIRAEAVVFDSGQLKLDGNADFLATPHLGVLAKVRLEDIALDYFRPITERYNLIVRQGVLSAAGDLEYGPAMKAVHLERATISGADLDYVYVPRAATPEKKMAKAAAQTAQQVANRPEIDLRIDRLRISAGRFGFVNKAATPSYRVFVADTELTLENLSNHLTAGTARAKLTGKFMGSGTTTVTAAFRPEVSGPDFDVNVRISDTEMRAMNDLLRAYGKFDVVDGRFSFYSELAVKDRWITGYVKPLFRNLDVYDKRQDAEKTAFRKLYERLVGGVAKLLENFPRDEVATKATIEGPVENPKARTLEVVVRLVQNAFFKAILPGFEREVPGGTRSPGKSRKELARAHRQTD